MPIHTFNSGVALDAANTWTANQTILGTLHLGLAGSTTGIITLQGSTSGVITLQPAAVAGTYTMTLPTAVAGAGEVLTDAAGNGVLSWAAAAVGNLTGDVTSDGLATTIAAAQVTYAKIQNVSATNRILGRDSASAGVIEEITPANVLTMLGVEASADVTDTTNVTAAGALMDSELAGIAAVKATTGTFLSADESKLDGIEASATADQTAGEVLTLIEDGVDSVHYKNGSIDSEHIAAGTIAMDRTTLVAGTNITLATNTLNVDDAFIKNDASDTTTGTITAAGLTTAGYITLSDDTPANQTGTGIIVTMTALTGLAVGEAVHIDTNGKLDQADANVASAADMPAIGIALTANSSGGDAEVNVLLLGIYRDDDAFAFDAGLPVYVSTTAGDLTKTAPSADGDFVQRVGIAITADMLYFNPSLDIIEHA